MSVAAILQAIRAAGEAQAEEIKDAAATEAQHIIAEAEAKAAEHLAARRREVLAALPAERVRREQRARLESDRIVGAARAALVEAALAETRAQLAALREQPHYPEVLRALLIEAVASLRADDGQMRVQADACDRRHLLPLLAEMQIPPEVVSFDEHYWGGVIVSEAECRIQVDNTLERRYERALSELYSLLGQTLFHYERV